MEIQWARCLSPSSFLSLCVRANTTTSLFRPLYPPRASALFQLPLFPPFASPLSQLSLAAAPSQIPPPDRRISFRRPYHAPVMEMEHPPSYYMRELPKEHLIGYDTVEGKRLFKHALLEGGLEAFFPLSQQFLTQNEPAYCGIGTLCMILNALKVDPAVTWRRPWRWFTQEMLDCCQPLEQVKKSGITLAEFSCLAQCNGLEATTKFANETTLEEFEEAIKASTFSCTQFLAVSYSRASLGQTGTGHFSPVGGYCSENGGMVLILDVARFKYPSYWVPIKMLFEALIPLDPTTNQPRGYSILRYQEKADNTTGSLFRLNATKQTWPSLFGPLWQSAKPLGSYKDLLATLVHALGDELNPVLSRYDDLSPAPTSGDFFRPPPSPTPGRTSYGTLESIMCKLEYQSRLDAFQEYLERKSQLYRLLDLEFGKLEVTIFFLGLFGTQTFLKHLQPRLQNEVRERTMRDLSDPWIIKEIASIRTQMESVDGCCATEGRCKYCPL